jgi:serine/threonine-protein kinase HipA
MASKAGIEMSECRLLEEGGRAHFMTRRFDRADDGRKSHAQTLCALGQLDFRQIGAHDYGQLFLLIDQLDLGPDTRAEAYCRMVFNVAAANCDDHTKNVSFLLPEDGAWRLSPAYDVTHAHAPTSRWTRQHLMAVNGRSTGISRSDLDEMGDRFAVPRASETIDRVLEATHEWSGFAAIAGVPADVAARIGADVETWSAPLR